ncbi:5-formyltetrahydrofolate cyclo-ligase [Parenemella sanctibonifatiensis]|uniref:5-formyltetrahydrofolate cyclo-ligase n=1 Tax=Parenemella sanctibonifatiensis TaxID=2016505 RepID=A0A255ELR7_9ACTN|nr:5-formyltetrahydrofolate cyclo-ligase [Parenemella sanctibonifatiensis]OYN92434.1 5-formyltetrahydrofolate cyclo-ligase [Parenemella sanctibonifatiensis]
MTNHESPVTPGPGPAAKSELRTVLRARRRGLDRAVVDDRRTAALLRVLAEPPAVVAAYWSRPDEPDTHALIDALVARGVRVLLPCGTDPDWAEHQPGQLRPGTYGVAEPTGTPLGAAALAEAGLILCPALAVDRSGRRLGKGGGWYDRALLHAAADAELWALVDVAEVLDQVPTEPHDRPVTGWVTEAGLARAGAPVGLGARHDLPAPAAPDQAAAR